MKTKHKYSRIKYILLLLCCLYSFAGCKKFIEVAPPPTSVNEGNVYSDDATASGSLTGVYAKMSNSFFSLDLTVLLELYADNLRLYSLNNANYTAYYQNILGAEDPQNISKLWLTVYPYVFTTNAAIKGLNQSTTLSSLVKQNLLGEAYFLRAFYYFYLVNLYGDVPLALTTDYITNNKLQRTAADQVYIQIISDLKQAQTLLSDDYIMSDALTVYPSGEEERVRPNRSAATALLARVYLYQKDWANAEFLATEIINKSNQFTITPLSEAFFKNSKETIWSLQPVKNAANTDEGELFTLRTGGPSDDGGRIIYLSNDFIDSFQSGDQRKDKWTGTQTDGTLIYPYAAKYKAVSGIGSVQEYTIVLRLAEQYLIRAEARIQQNNLSNGVSDLNVLRKRAIDESAEAEHQLKLLATNLSKDDALAALNYERRVELFCEWGHRWFDLKRTEQIDAVMNLATPKKGGSEWSPYRSIFPVPSEEIRINSLLSQNPGYVN